MKVDLSSTSKIRPCPLCASEAFLHTNRTSSGVPSYWVKCADLQCGCTVRAVKDQPVALSLWNRRGA